MMKRNIKTLALTYIYTLSAHTVFNVRGNDLYFIAQRGHIHVPNDYKIISKKLRHLFLM